MKLLSPLSNPLRLLSWFFAVSSLSLATPILFNRGLPDTTNTNDGASRSNVDWVNQLGGVAGGGFINGDNFNLGFSATGVWFVDTISVWVVLNVPGDLPLSEFSDFKLYGGLESDPGSFGLISTGFSTSIDRYTPSAGGPCDVASSGEDYLSRTGPICLPIYKITFFVNLAIPGPVFGVNYDFAADGTGIGGNLFYSHATNAALAGTAQPGSDGQYLNWDTLAFAAGPVGVNSDSLCGTAGHGPDPRPTGGICAGWDKQSDINVVVTGAQEAPTPEPSSIGMLGAGLVAVLAMIRRRRRG